MNSHGPSEEDLFEAALQLADPAERATYLQQACGDDVQLRQRVESLLAAQVEAGTFIDKPAGGQETVPSSTRDVAPSNEQSGERIGRFKLLEKIGEGGFGDVWMAEQEEPVRRRVALKIIKVGMDTREVVARFEAERQALALMDHPSIAKVFDGGATDTGRPYFVMELVRGVPITKYCDEHRLSVSERLELFIQVCQAVQHAHQKGIIHRDIKPSNVLVSPQNDRPIPKVIDFGIAKATAQRLTNKTLFTRFHQFVGTPAYMSPEQAVVNREDVDTRSDIYSLGVLLYELLTGNTPFDARKLLEAGYEAILKTIREEEPPKPSTRLTTLTKEELGLIASGRRTAPDKLGKTVRGELDWIVMKCLEKDRTRRYETANGLAMDLHRYLRDEPVVAAPPSAAYRFRRFAIRNKVPLVTAMAFALVLISATVVSTWQAVRATRANERERTETLKSQQVAKFLQEMLEGVRPSVALGRDKTLLRDILDKAAARVGKELRGQPDVEAELRHTIARAYAEMGEYAQAKVMLRESLAIRKELFGNEHVEVAKSLVGLAAVLVDESKLAEAEAMIRQALAMQKNLLGDKHQDVARSLNILGGVLWKGGKPREAEPLMRQALAMQRNLFGEEHADVAGSLNGLAAILLEGGKPREAESLFRESLEMTRKLLGNEHPSVATSLNNLASVLSQEGQLAEAEALFREVLAMQKKLLGNEHPDVAMSLNNLASVLSQEGQMAEAEVMHREALAMRKKLLGNEHPDVAMSLNNLANVIATNGTLGEAELLLREALALQKKVLGDEHPGVAISLNNLANVLSQEGKLAEAEALHRESLGMRKRLLGYQHPDVVESFNGLAGALWKQGKWADAEPQLRELLSLQRKLRGDRHPDVAQTLGWLAHATAEQGKLAEADSIYREALALEKGLRRDVHKNLASLCGNFARLLWKQGKLGEAEPMAREALAIQTKLSGNENADVAHSLKLLALVLCQKGDLASGEAMLREALALQKKLFGDAHLDLAVTLIALAAALSEQAPAEAETFLRQALAMQQKLLGDEHQDVAFSLNFLARLLRSQGKLAEAEATARQALAMQRRLLGDKHPEVATSLHNLADMLARRGIVSSDKLERFYAENVNKFKVDDEVKLRMIFLANKPERDAKATKKLAGELLAKIKAGTSFAELASVHSDASQRSDGGLWERVGRTTLREDLARAAFSLKPGETSAILESDHGCYLIKVEELHQAYLKPLAEVRPEIERELRLAEAEPLAREALAIRRELLGEEHADTASSRELLGWVVMSQGKLAVAEPLFRDALTVRKKLLGDTHPQVATIRNNLAYVLRGQGKSAEAKLFSTETPAPTTESDRARLGLLRSVGDSCARAGRWKEAAESFAKAIEAEPANHELYHSLAPLLVQSGDLESYRRHCQSILARFGGTYDPVVAERMAKDCLILPSSGASLETVSELADTAVSAEANHWAWAFFQFVKGWTEYRQGHFASAVEWTQRSLSKAGEVPFRDVEAYMVLAMAHHQLKHPEEARAALAKGVEIAEAKLPKLESGDIGDAWIDWIIAHALLCEAKAMIEGQSPVPDDQPKQK